MYILGDHSLKNFKPKDSDAFWKKAREQMKNPDAFLTRLKNFEVEDQLSDEKILKNAIKIVNEAGDPNQVLKASFAASKL